MRVRLGWKTNGVVPVKETKLMPRGRGLLYGTRPRPAIAKGYIVPEKIRNRVST
jgi:hypothetical protein